MARAVSIGAQGYADMRENDDFLVDKTGFIRDWWNSRDIVTLICRPRRFGKTLNLDMLDCFFSTRYECRADLFEGLEVWDDEQMRAEQGRWPVVSISFAGIKGRTAEEIEQRLCERIALLYREHSSEIDLDTLGDEERALFTGKRMALVPSEIPSSLIRLCELLSGAHGRDVIVLIDEYDTPLQEAWIDGCWDELLGVMRPLFNATLKSNPFLKRAIITGITRVARESIFSDLNNLKVVTTTSNMYETDFGFTEEEVFAAMDEFGLDDRAGVREWYDGFEFGGVPDIYNPWSITNYLDEGELAPYWANTSSNGLVSLLISTAGADLKGDFGKLLCGETVHETINEQISFPDLDYDQSAIWSLLVASGYLKIIDKDELGISGGGVPCELAVVNRETIIAFEAMVHRWFLKAGPAYNGFIQALLSDDLDGMNDYMNEVALATFSTFDSGKQPAISAPERFYHGFVLGLLVDLRGRYQVRSNRESGYGRYDVMLVPCDAARDPGIVIEFKVRNARREASLDETVASALVQIEEKAYATELVEAGVPESRIRSYGFAFEGKQVLIGEAGE